MVDILPATVVLTPSDAGTQLQSKGLDALGLAMPALATGWAASTPTLGDVADDAMTIALSGVRAPFQGLLHREALPVFWTGADGSPVSGPVAVLRLHPDAAAKLEDLVGFALGSPIVRPVPVAMVIRGVPAPPAPPATEAVTQYQAGQAIANAPGSAVVSFHDDRGLPIDPLAVASLLLAVQQALPGIAYGDTTQPALGAGGGLSGIAALGARVRFHVVDPHGGGYTPTRDAARLKLVSGPTPTDIGDGGLGTWTPAATIGRAAADAAGDDATPRLFWGFGRNATLARTALAVPTPTLAAGVVAPVNQFFRIVAVDLDWHLLGNRGDTEIAGVPADDDAVPDYALPVVRPFVPGARYLVDAQDVLGQMGAITAAFPPSGVGVQLLLCSPVIDDALKLPPAPGAAGHWPQFPAGPLAVLPPGVDATVGISGTWASGAGPADAIVTIAAGLVPDGTHVRVYPRRFQSIRAIGERPSFVRGDGGSGIVAGGTSTSVFIANPFALLPAEARPSPADLMVDVVVTGRDGATRTMSMVKVTLGADQPFTPQAQQGNAALQSAGIVALMAAFGSTSVAPSGLFGIPETQMAGAQPASTVDLVRAFASESTRPRIGPRLPSMARFDTVLAVGSGPTGTLLQWQAVVSGARWSEESRSAQPELADPGNPAGPDVFATGFAASGQLAQDLAVHAMKRAQPILPIAPNTMGWIVAMGGNNWNPAPLDAPAATVSGVMLETVAPICDSPELSLIPEVALTQTAQQLITSAASALGVGAPTVTVGNEAQIRARVQREATTARVGQKDALWALRRAIHQARDFIYIETPQFASTGAVDLVTALDDALVNNPRLVVMIAVPRTPDFDQTTTKYEPWVRGAFASRKSALEALVSPHRERVAAFHPIGFPGRPTFVRSTTVVVDDVFALVGSSHFRRRGLTFDGGCDVASIDRALDADGASTAIRAFRRSVMASRLGVTPTGAPAMWTRLATGWGGFSVLVDLLSAGGLGRCQPVWEGPTDNEVIPKGVDDTDPAGGDESIFAALWKLAGDP